MLHADSGMKEGTPDIQHAGALAFAAHSILLVGDTLGAAVFAFDTGDGQATSGGKSTNIEGFNQKIAAMMGSYTEETVINDIAVNPLSGNLYLSVARGRGPDSMPVIFRTDSKVTLSELSLKKVKFRKATIANAHEPKEGKRNPRMSVVTDMQYKDGQVFVAGLSNVLLVASTATGSAGRQDIRTIDLP